MSDVRTPSKAGFIAFVILSVAALMTDFASLVLVTTWLRGTEAAYPVYAVGAALTLAAAVILIVRRKDIATIAKDAMLSAKFFASLRRYSIFERAFSDYGWRTLLSAFIVLAGNVVCQTGIIRTSLGAILFGAFAQPNLANMYTIACVPPEQNHPKISCSEVRAVPRQPIFG